MVFFAVKSDVYLQFIELTCTVAALTQLTYCSWILASLRWQYQASSSITRLIRQLCVLFILNSLVSILAQLTRAGLVIDFGFNGYLLSYLAVLLAVLLLVRDLVFDGGAQINFASKEVKQKNVLARPSLAYKYSQLDWASLREIENKITNCLKDQQIYLQPDVTLENFSAQIQVPKQQVSQVLNVYMGKNFYKLIAEYRIKYALQSIQVNHRLKIEALAYECGFNSVSAFNRYFKEIVGVPPSVHIKKLLK
ncbi:AraC family transcriptional regulator [Pedobacter sp. V48]|uniref:helix-turn-helix domain-containing protein n=1 Tax=Pedobacter sp. V48 TaxID=509635 RepID=UPI001377666F|nr:helix-turn-helix domain-containing protein [Pedobacter sp. V48]